MSKTYLGSIREAKQILKKNQISSSKLNAELLLSYVLNCPKVYLYLNGNKILTKEQEKKLNSLIQKRISGKPLQYILGETEFYGLKLEVNKKVLIPRPETEMLVENVINFFSDKKEKLFIIDWGTGSGNIAIALAKNLNCYIYALDVSKPALEVAKKNALKNKVSQKIKFGGSNSFQALNKKLYQKIDCLIANPPYIRENEFENLPKEIKDFEPKVALLDKKKGLFYHKKIISEGKDFLKKGGLLALEVALGQAQKIVKLIQQNGNYESIKIKKDLSGIERVVLAKRN